MGRRSIAAAVLLAILAAAPRPAGAQEIKIVEIFPGTVASPSAQYVVLQYLGNGGPALLGKALVFSDPAGAEVARLTFSANVANQGDQAVVLVATASASALFGVAADFVFPTPVVQPTGGRLCLDFDDCVTWTRYFGPGGEGVPINDPGGALRLGRGDPRYVAG